MSDSRMTAAARAELRALSALELRRRLAEGEVTAADAALAFLDAAEAENPRRRAFTSIARDAALERAAELDARRAAGEEREASKLEAAPLWGVPFGDKDLVDRAGVVTTWGSVVGLGRVAEASARLVLDMDASGGVSIGKTNCPEFGFPAYTENRIGEPARNPWDETRTPGGSSGGAAVAVAAGLLPFAPGSDGGGSIRIPAAACGLVGLKTSRGRIPGGSGVDALAGLPVAGPLARSTGDAALLLDGMIGPRSVEGRSRDPFALAAPGGERSYLRALEGAGAPRRLRLGVSRWSPWSERMPIAVSERADRALELAIERLAAAGHEIVQAPEPEGWQGYSDAFRTVWQAGGAALPLPDEALAAVEPLTRWLVGVGRERTAAELAGALAWLAGFEARAIDAYAEFDAVLTPMLADAPPPLGSFDQEDGERNFEQQCQFTPFTSYVNVAGLPAISMPVLHDGMPFGVQAIGRPGDELGLLVLARQLERELEWDRRRPPGVA